MMQGSPALGVQCVHIRSQVEQFGGHLDLLGMRVECHIVQGRSPIVVLLVHQVRPIVAQQCQ